MNVKKVEVEDLFYYEGEVTADDIEVGEVTTRENIGEDERWPSSSITSHISLKLNEDLRELLGYNDMPERGICDYAVSRGVSKVAAYTSIKSIKGPAIKRLRTNHKKDCERDLSEVKIAREIDQIVSHANWHIKQIRDKFIQNISRAFSGRDVEWDNEERLDELDDARSELRGRIKKIEDEMKEIMAKETAEWLAENVDDAELRESILSNTHYTSYLGDGIFIDSMGRKRKKKKVKTT